MYIFIYARARTHNTRARIHALTHAHFMYVSIYIESQQMLSQHIITA